MRYDHPNFGVIRTQFTVGVFSASAAGTAWAGSTLKVYTKAAVLGCQFEVLSGPSLSASPTVGIGKLEAGGSLTTYGSQTCPLDKGASALGTVFDISLTTPMTLTSFKEGAVLIAPSGTAADKGFVIRSIIWRYRILPKLTEQNESM